MTDEFIGGERCNLRFENQGAPGPFESEVGSRAETYESKDLTSEMRENLKRISTQLELLTYLVTAMSKSAIEAEHAMNGFNQAMTDPLPLEEFL